MRILKKIAIGLLIFLVVLGIAGFFIAPPLVKPYSKYRPKLLCSAD